MAVSLLVVAGLIFAGLLGLFPLGGDAMGLTGYKLGIALLGNFVGGGLLIGLYYAYVNDDRAYLKGRGTSVGS